MLKLKVIEMLAISARSGRMRAVQRAIVSAIDCSAGIDDTRVPAVEKLSTREQLSVRWG
jgi:hypothetical protein